MQPLNNKVDAKPVSAPYDDSRRSLQQISNLVKSAGRFFIISEANECVGQSLSHVKFERQVIHSLNRIINSSNVAK